MKIVIAGAGEVGKHLSMLLSHERHDITLIDEDPDKLSDVGNKYDILTIDGSPLSIRVLKEAEAGNADLFIGVTPDEAHNLTCCLLARKLGANKTVARVDKYENTLPENREFFKSIGIDSIIYPEMLAGHEIMHNIRHSWIRQWIEFEKGELIMIGVKLRQGAALLDIPLKDLCGPDSSFHVVAIKRSSGETIIPHGADILKNGDMVYFMTHPSDISEIRTLAGKEDYPDIHNIIIMGGSSTAMHAISQMPDSMHAKIIEDSDKRCEILGEVIENRHTMIIHGDGRDIELLKDEGIGQVQAFAALTGNSEANILACLAAKRMGVRKTVAMVENINYINMAQSLDIGTVINKKTFAASHIYQMMLKADVTTMKTLTVANADVAEFHVAENSPITNKCVKDLGLPANVTLGGLVRNGKGYLINGATLVRANDRVVVFCLGNAIQKISKYFVS